MFQHILVPLDGSAESELALKPALSLAEAYGGARITLLAVMIRFPESKLQIAKMDAQSEQRGEEYLQEVVGRLGPHSMPLDIKVRLGVPAAEIIAEAIDSKVDLLVLSTHGTSGTERNLHSIGSTAWRVLHDSPCPTVLIPVKRE